MGLPLFRLGKSRCCQSGQDTFDGGLLAQQQIIRASGGNSVGTLRCEDDGSALADNPSRRRHAFDPLIQILVQRESRIGGDHHLEWSIDWLHGRPPHGLASGPVGRGEFPSEDTSDIFPIVQCDIEQKTGTYALGDFQHLFPHRIPLAVAETGLGVAQILSPVVAHDGVHMGHARHDAFRAAAEPCEEMRLDEPRDDPDIGFHTLSINPSWNTVSCRSEGHTGIVVEGFMIEDPPVRHHFGREQLL